MLEFALILNFYIKKNSLGIMGKLKLVKFPRSFTFVPSLVLREGTSNSHGLFVLLFLFTKEKSWMCGEKEVAYFFCLDSSKTFHFTL